MFGQDLRAVLDYVRVRQLFRYALRSLGLPAVAAEDFLVQLQPQEGERLRDIAAAVRGPDAPPAVFVHGVLPRSGTNFLADALALHPAVHAHPGQLWEYPLLYVARGAEALQQEFLLMFKPNRDVLGRFDFLAYLASGWLAALQQEAPGRRMLFKSPHVQNLTLFRHLFPDDILVLCLRDGRDVIQSSLKTFSRWNLRSKGFSQLAREWRFGTEAILTFEPGGENAYPNATVVRYEQLVRDPKGVVRRLLDHARLDPDQYDFDALDRLPVRGSSSFLSTGYERWEAQAKPEGFQPIGRWHEAWSRRQRSRFEAIAGATAIRAGYAAKDRA